jgi:hypothetical protein
LPDLIVVGSFPGRPDFRGLGELVADELETLWRDRATATPDVLAAAVAAWDAVRASDPVALARLATEGVPELPYLAEAARRLLEELPAPVDGLSGTERRAVEAIVGGFRTPAAAFVAAQELEDAPFLGDTWFYRTLAALGAGENRLVETDDGQPLPAPPPLGDGQRFTRLRLRLTDAGRAALVGEIDRVELLGIDRWVGGTRVTGDGVWRWDPGASRLSRP